MRLGAVYAARLVGCISIHAPRERCDLKPVSTYHWSLSFQSTHRVSDATTVRELGFLIAAGFQSTHRVSDATIFDIFGSGNSKFQSTHRVSDATSSQRYQVYNPHISIHAPRERCDEVPATHRNVNTTLISIHAPRERCDMTLIAIFCKAFSISIHAPRERCDAAYINLGYSKKDFNPRTA